ncbi:MAG: hypothetical protein AAF206_29170 [Bacteroidota bacterium]
MSDDIRAGAALNINAFNPSTVTNFFHATPLRLDVFLAYQLEEKLNAKAELRIFGPTNFTAEESRTLYPELNLSADYRITPQFSVFAQVNNMLNTRYQRWFLYPERRIDFMAGISLSF